MCSNSKAIYSLCLVGIQSKCSSGEGRKSFLQNGKEPIKRKKKEKENRSIGQTAPVNFMTHPLQTVSLLPNWQGISQALTSFLTVLLKACKQIFCTVGGVCVVCLCAYALFHTHPAALRGKLTKHCFIGSWVRVNKYQWKNCLIGSHPTSISSGILSYSGQTMHCISPHPCKKKRDRSLPELLPVRVDNTS